MSELTKLNQPSTAVSVQNLLDKLSSLKREAYVSLDQALTFDSNTSNTDTKVDTSIIMYERCLKYIENALSFYNLNRSSLMQHEDAILTYNKLISMKNQTSDRLNELKTERMKTRPRQASSAANSTLNNNSNDEFLDIGDEILNDNDDDCVIIDDFSDEDAPQNRRLSNEEAQLRNKMSNMSKASEILRLDNGIQMFYIADDGTVSTPSYPTTLSIYSFDKDKVSRDSTNGKNVVGFIRVGSWLYPLVPNELPAMKTTFNAYIFPNNEENDTSNKNQIKCSFIGLTLANQLDTENKQFFEDILANYGLLIHQNREEAGAKQPGLSILGSSLLTPSSQANNSIQPTVVVDSNESAKRKEAHDREEEKTKPAASDGWTADNIASGLISGAQYVSQGISTTSDYASKYLKTGADKLKSQLTPNQEAVQVDPKVQSLVQNVRYGTHVGVRVTSFLLGKLGSLATYTAKTVGPSIRQGSTAILTKSGIAGDKGSANNYVDNVCTVAKGSIQSYGIVYDSLEKAAKSLGKNFTEHTVTVVEHKYGPSAAQTTKNGMYSVGNVALTVNNFRNFKVVRTVAKATAKEVITSSSTASKAKQKEAEAEASNNEKNKSNY